MTFEDRYDSAWGGTGYEDTEDWEDSHEQQEEDGVYYNTDKDEKKVREDAKQRDAERGLDDNYRSFGDWLRQNVPVRAVAAGAAAIGIAAVYGGDR